MTRPSAINSIIVEMASIQQGQCISRKGDVGISVENISLINNKNEDNDKIKLNSSNSIKGYRANVILACVWIAIIQYTYGILAKQIFRTVYFKMNLGKIITADRAIQIRFGAFLTLDHKCCYF